MNNNETFIYMGGDMVVPQDVVRVRVHPSVTVIPERAFEERSKLEEIELCEGLLEIGEKAFRYCKALKHINIPSTVTRIGSFAFSGGWGRRSALKRISIPSSVRVIGDNAFDYCSKLEDVELCEGLLEIGSHAFMYCSALKSIRIPSTVTIIHKWAFIICEKLRDVELCDGLLEIKEAAFFSCGSLKQIRIPSTVNTLGKAVFKECGKLAKVELSEGLVEIGEHVFYGCYSMTTMNIPSTVKTIGCWAFCNVPLTSLLLPDVDSIGDHAFLSWYGSFTIVRIPPTITAITEQMCSNRSVFSMEIPTSIERIDEKAFDSCIMLRNLSLPSNVEIGVDVFKDCLDLKQLGSECNIIKILKHRFDNLPVHKMLYYQSYDQNRVLRSNNGSLISMLDDPSIKQQDSLGMTPLHILACSTVQNIELYKVLIEKHPESLITKDKWGALPLLYAVWGDAGKEIEQLLVQSYKSIFPNYVFNWTMMIETFTLANVPCVPSDSDRIRCLHLIQLWSFPDQCIDWDTNIEKAITLSNPENPRYVSPQILSCLVLQSISKRGLALRNKSLMQHIIVSIWEDSINNSVQSRRDFVKNIHKKLEVCEVKSQKFIEALTMIELLLWKMKMDDCCGQQKETRRSKKLRMDDTTMRKQCRLRCGAETNIVIEHVLPYLDILST